MNHFINGFCNWDFPTFLLVAVMAIMLIVHQYRFQKRKKQWEKKLEGKNKEKNPV